MAIGFVCGGHWTLCDLYGIIRRCDCNGLKMKSNVISFNAMYEKLFFYFFHYKISIYLLLFLNYLIW